MYESFIREGQKVTFPRWQGDRHYMLPFTTASGLPKSAERFQDIVDQMMLSVCVSRSQVCHLMVDEKYVAPGDCHRRPGLHVDGYWIAGLRCHGGKHSPVPQHHSPSPEEPKPKKNKKKATEAILLASSYTAARAFVGNYERDFIADWRGGDCSELGLGGLKEVTMRAGVTYLMDVFTLHESLPMDKAVLRSVLRINVPNYEAAQ